MIHGERLKKFEHLVVVHKDNEQGIVSRLLGSFEGWGVEGSFLNIYLLDGSLEMYPLQNIKCIMLIPKQNKRKVK